MHEVTGAILYEIATINHALLRLLSFMNRLRQRTARDRGQLRNATYQNSK